MCVTALGKTRARPYAPPVLGSDPRGLVFLIASLLALAAAPLLHRLALRSARTLAISPPGISEARGTNIEVHRCTVLGLGSINT